MNSVGVGACRRRLGCMGRQMMKGKAGARMHFVPAGAGAVLSRVVSCRHMDRGTAMMQGAVHALRQHEARVLVNHSLICGRSPTRVVRGHAQTLSIARPTVWQARPGGLHSIQASSTRAPVLPELQEAVTMCKWAMADESSSLSQWMRRASLSPAVLLGRYYFYYCKPLQTDVHANNH